MVQPHCYVPDDVASSLKRRPEQAGTSVSRHLAKLAKRDIGKAWPEGYFERVFKRDDRNPIAPADQGAFEQRSGLDE